MYRLSVFIAVIILFGVPTYLGSTSGLLDHPHWYTILAFCLSPFCYLMLWAYANEQAFVAALDLYGVDTSKLPFGGGVSPRTKGATLVSLLAAYATTTYGFGLTYRFIQMIDSNSFGALQLNNLIAATYFSVVTIATVGYGDISPKTDLARILVVLEIFFGLGYSVFFLSIVATFVRDALQPKASNSSTGAGSSH